MSTVIKLKPLGAVAVLGALGVLSLMAFRNTGAKSTPVVGEKMAMASSVPAAVTAALPTSDDARSLVYTDGLGTDWQYYGWAKDVVLNEPRFVHSGAKSIRVTFQPFEGAKFFHPAFATKDYDRVSFSVMGSGAGGQVLAINGTRLSSDDLKSSVQLDALPAGRWVTVVIPLKKLALADVPDMTSFYIQDAAGKKSLVYFDDLRLLQPGESEPAGPQLSLAK